jgi:hypothetical protein
MFTGDEILRWWRKKFELGVRTGKRRSVADSVAPVEKLLKLKGRQE